MFIYISIQCMNKFFEVLTDDIEGSKQTIAELAKFVLLGQFGTVSVESLRLSFSLAREKELKLCSIQVHAYSPDILPTSSPDERTEMEVAVEVSFSSILLELFGSVENAEVLIAA